MGPTRTTKTRKPGESSSAASKPKLHRVRQNNEHTVFQPGVQKLKASVRQTRRLLAKDNLAADVRVETERRLKALEADLAHGEAAKKERGLAIRYHKIKFFERQKVVRKLNQAKKQLALALKQEDADDSSIKKIQGSITELQVDLNYILHYPKSKKYISLFPPELRHPNAASQNQCKQTSESTSTATDREEMRTWIRTRMQNGELAVPEAHMDMESKISKNTSTQHRRDTYVGDGWDGSRDEVKTGKGRVNVDAFFGDDDEDEDEDEEEEEEMGD